MRIFEPDNPLMEALSRIADLVILNLVVLVFCLPVFTIGAALTGMHYVLLRMVRNEEGYVVRSFLKSCRENFLQATGMWLLFLVFGCIFVLDMRLVGGVSVSAGGSGAVFAITGGTAGAAGTGALAGTAAEAAASPSVSGLPAAFRYVLAAGGLFIFMIFLYTFPLLARFQNTVGGTLRNAATLAIAAFPRTLGMAAATIALPLAVCFFIPAFPVLLLAGISLPGFACAHLYSPLFARMEKRMQEGQAQKETQEDAPDGCASDTGSTRSQVACRNGPYSADSRASDTGSFSCRREDF